MEPLELPVAKEAVLDFDPESRGPGAGATCPYALRTAMARLRSLVGRLTVSCTLERRGLGLRVPIPKLSCLLILRLGTELSEADRDVGFKFVTELSRLMGAASVRCGPS